MQIIAIERLCKITMDFGNVNNLLMNASNQTDQWACDWIHAVPQILLDRLTLAEKIIFIILGIFVNVGNIIVLVATWRERSLHQSNKYFIACLAVADFLVGIFLIPLRLYFQFADLKSILPLSNHLCDFLKWIFIFALTASIYSLMFISFDRYIKISKPLQYRSRMTTSKAMKIIFAVWFLACAFATYATFAESGVQGNVFAAAVCPSTNYKKTILLLFFVITIFLPTFIMLVMYILVFLAVYKRQKALENGELGQTFQIRNNAFLKNIKAIKMLLVVVGVFILCWGPYVIAMLLYMYYPKLSDTSCSSLRYQHWILIIFRTINILPYLNSLCNPIIYACLDQTYREAFKNLFR